MTEHRPKPSLVAIGAALMPIWFLFGLMIDVAAPSEMLGIVMFAGIVTATLVGCSFGGYDSGILWHYHGVPEHVARPDVEKLKAD